MGDCPCFSCPCSSRSPRAPGGGFTLLELIVAMTLTVLVTGTTVVMLRSITGTRERVERYGSVHADARAAIDAVTSALRNAYRSGSKDERLVGQDDLQGGYPSDRIRLFIVSHRPVRRGQPESDVRECELFLHQKEMNAPPSLMRRLDPTRNDRPDGGGIVEPVAANIVALDISYFEAGRWIEEWTEERTGWPRAVRVRIAAMRAEPPRRVVRLERIVNFPYWPRKEEGGGDSEGES